MTTKKLTQFEILREAGFEAAQNMLSEAVKSAKDANQMNNQLTVCEWAAIAILGTMLFNEMKQSDTPEHEYINDVCQGIKAYAANLKDDVEFIPPGGL